MEKSSYEENSAAGKGYMPGAKPKKVKDPSCPSGGYVYGHSKHAGASPSPRRKKG